MSKLHPHIPLTYVKPSIGEAMARASSYREMLQTRRSVRYFSNEPVPKELIEHLIMTASSAPSGANKQPWSFCAVSDRTLKKEIRKAAEKEEYENYHGRMSDEWLEDLSPLGTDHHKPFLEIAPWLIAIFKKPYEYGEDGKQKRNYYVNESVGLAAGFLISAIHYAGLVTLTHTPSPMKFLRDILKRPDNERAFLLLPVGFPSPDCTVPNIRKKSLEEVGIFY